MTNGRETLSSDEIKQIISWVYQAGQIARRYFNNVTPQEKSDLSFITQADLEIERFLIDRLQSNFPGYGLISEDLCHIFLGRDSIGNLSLPPVNY